MAWPSTGTATINFNLGANQGGTNTQVVLQKVSGGTTTDLATSGTISGNFKLTGAQATALRSGKLYIQINSEKAPEVYPWGPKGTLWGWLFPAHETVGANVPQQDHWFIPQLDTPCAKDAENA